MGNYLQPLNLDCRKFEDGSYEILIANSDHPQIRLRVRNSYTLQQLRELFIKRTKSRFPPFHVFVNHFGTEFLEWDRKLGDYGLLRGCTLTLMQKRREKPWCGIHKNS